MNLDETEFQELEHQPSTSRVQMEQRGAEVTLTVPPLGVWHRGSQATSFVIGLLALSGPVLGAAAFGAFWLADVKGAKNMWPVFPIFLLLGLLGGGMLLAAINMGRRHALLTVVGDRLTVRQTGVFGGKRGQWQREQIDDVRTGPCGLPMGQENLRPALELQIHTRPGRKFGLLAGRDPAELAWMATVLRRALQLSSPIDPAPAS